MRVLLIFFLFFLSQLSWAQQKEVCFTFDDLPVVTYRHNSQEFKQEVTLKLVEGLYKNQIPATGFVNERKLYTREQADSLQISLLKMWLDKDLDLGNHTYSHPNYHKVPFNTYAEDILKGEVLCKPLVKSYNKDYHYFRHPYLRSGKTKSSTDSLASFLRLHGYKEAPVSIDNDDYLFAFAYDSAMHAQDSLLMKKIGREFVDYMERKLLFYERSSNTLFERNIKHILLLHANSLNGDYLDELAEMFRKNNYRFISLEEALTDEAYATEVTRFGDWGISWIDRWALSRGMKGDFFKGDPEPPEFIKKLAEK